MVEPVEAQFLEQVVLAGKAEQMDSEGDVVGVLLQALAGLGKEVD